MTSHISRQKKVIGTVGLLVVFIGKALNGMLPSLCRKQVVGPSSLLVLVAQSDEIHANRA